MRQIYNLNTKWAFSKEAEAVPASMPERWYWVTLPHTWNAIDGQDGGNDMYRGTAYYAKEIEKVDLPEAERYYLEFNGANSSAKVYVNGKEVACHDGGYSTWRVDVTDELTDKTLIVVEVDNGKNERVYPQYADFSFYGGLYRDVNMVCVNESHFDLDYYGGKGLVVTPRLQGEDAIVRLQAYVTNKKENQSVHFIIKDASGVVVAETRKAEVTNDAVDLEQDIKNVHRWHGRKDPYLYTAVAELVEDGAVIDMVEAKFGCRTFEIDPEKGFFLNGKAYPLRGMSRHQDRWGIGNALLPEHHEEDMDMLCEIGATTIRLAHYQHDQYFYDLCDEKGMVIWAEIPYISQHLNDGRENTITQMKELIVQNYNHPSIVVWGLSNEITMQAGDHEDMIENHHILNDMVHEMDKTRLTTIAVISACSMDDPYIQIPDTVAWNHYYGWYGGTCDMNGPWLDKFHAAHPNIPVGMSEYGCEALNWHSSKPRQGDYTEEYQAYYHEELIKQLFTRDYLWATHVWNMFDFGADSRNEGGENGQNHKGLVTFDRKYKKDSFYAYKAWLSDEPFVHVCGKRYVDRVEEMTKVTVYSNLPEVELFANGVSLGKKTAEDHFFYFEVPNTGETTVKAVAGDCTDESFIRKVEKFNDDYRFKEGNAILNWFDITEPEGYLALTSCLSEVLEVPEGKAYFMELMGSMMAKMGGGKPGQSGGMAATMLSPEMLQMMGSFTILRLLGMLDKRLDKGNLTKEDLLAINAKLNTIKMA